MRFSAEEGASQQFLQILLTARSEEPMESAFAHLRDCRSV
jgi:hypothetical protein